MNFTDFLLHISPVAKPRALLLSHFYFLENQSELEEDQKTQKKVENLVMAFAILWNQFEIVKKYLYDYIRQV